MNFKDQHNRDGKGITWFMLMYVVAVLFITVVHICGQVPAGIVRIEHRVSEVK